MSLDTIDATIRNGINNIPSLDALKDDVQSTNTYPDTPEDTVDSTYNIPKSIECKEQLGHPLGNYDAPISSPYGMRKHPIHNTMRFHKGVDMPAATGTAVYATMDGTISIKYDADGYGKYIVIKGNNGVETRYAHLSSTDIQDGSTVKTGDMIGTVGNTGASTGPHLHYEVRINNIPTDPQQTLKQPV